MQLRHMAALAGTATLIATALVANPSSAANTDPAASNDERMQRTLAAAKAELRTPFETSNGETWTTVSQAQKFRRDLDASSDRVSVQKVGKSGQGRPLELISVGYPRPKTLDAAADGSVALFNCSIHGNEPAGREACLQLARDLSSTNDPTVKRLLTDTTVQFINVNPDGWEANTRGNADGIDVNRDFMKLETPEARTLAKLIRDGKPDVLNDLHEYGPSKYYKDHALQLWPRNRNVDDAIHNLSKNMVNNYAAPQVESHDGYTAGIYGEYKKDGEPFLQVAGDGQGRILRNYTGLQHITGQLTETATGALTPQEQADPALRNRRRVTVEYASATGTMDMVLENRARLARQSDAAAKRATQAGANRSGVVYFAGQDNMLPTSSDEVEPEPMCGYQLSRAQLSSLRTTLRLHGITWERNSTGAYVTLAQPDKPLIPLLLDERSEYRLTEATPVQTC